MGSIICAFVMCSLSHDSVREITGVNCFSPSIYSIRYGSFQWPKLFMEGSMPWMFRTRRSVIVDVASLQDDDGQLVVELVDGVALLVGG